MYSSLVLQSVSALYLNQAKVSLLSKTEHVMSLPAIQNVLFLCHSHLSSSLQYILFFSLSTKVLTTIIWSLVFYFIIFRLYLTFFEAVLLILKHATVLRLSQRANSALAQADLDYQKAKIDLTVQQHPLAYSPGDTVEQFIGFIMATEIGVFVLLSVTIISHQAFSAFPVFSISRCIEKTISLNSFGRQFL